MKNCFLGIDIGGTKTAISLADNNGFIVDSSFIETKKSKDFSVIQNEIFSAADQLLLKNNISAKNFKSIGISCPGPLDVTNGIIVYVPTTGWKNYPIVDEFKKKFKVPVMLENDCSCAAFGELKNGAGKGYRSIVYITVSTGVGCGICINDALYTGETGIAGELGHICVEQNGKKCSCGSTGCLELYSSGTAIAAIASERSKKEKSILSGKKNITALDVETAVRNGDELANDIWNDAMEKLGVASSIIYLLINPGVIIYGGGVSNAWDLMEERLLSSMKKHIHTELQSEIKIRRAALGKVVGTTGAILLSKAAFKTTGSSY